MFLCVNASGLFWDGWNWSEKGREFFSVASVQRSLHEEGESVENVIIVDTFSEDLT